jgi:hypothetical protein
LGEPRIDLVSMGLLVQSRWLNRYDLFIMRLAICQSCLVGGRLLSEGVTRLALLYFLWIVSLFCLFVLIILNPRMYFVLVLYDSVQ